MVSRQHVSWQAEMAGERDRAERAQGALVMEA
jgi:hypothetical protein